MPEPASLVPAAALHGLDAPAMTAAIRPLFEDAPWLAGRLAGLRYRSWDELIDRAQAALDAATDDERAATLRSHPRLGAAQQQLRRRSEASWREQGAGRPLDDAVLDALADANDRYEAHFGFPFVDFVAGRPLDAMVPVIDGCLGNDPHDELRRACRALVDIARDRLGGLRDAAAAP